MTKSLARTLPRTPSDTPRTLPGHSSDTPRTLPGHSSDTPRTLDLPSTSKSPKLPKAHKYVAMAHLFDVLLVCVVRIVFGYICSVFTCFGCFFEGGRVRFTCFLWFQLFFAWCSGFWIEFTCVLVVQRVTWYTGNCVESIALPQTQNLWKPHNAQRKINKTMTTTSESVTFNHIQENRNTHRNVTVWPKNKSSEPFD